jgi:hypothetical protein
MSSRDRAVRPFHQAGSLAARPNDHLQSSLQATVVLSQARSSTSGIRLTVMATGFPIAATTVPRLPIPTRTTRTVMVIGINYQERCRGIIYRAAECGCARSMALTSREGVMPRIRYASTMGSHFLHPKQRPVSFVDPAASSPASPPTAASRQTWRRQ